VPKVKLPVFEDKTRVDCREIFLNVARPAWKLDFRISRRLHVIREPQLQREEWNHNFRLMKAGIPYICCDSCHAHGHD
jgi:hypothetical protein